MAENEQILKTQNGGISVDVEHIFPIIKKWLYSEKEIFIREIVSNASDAVTKLKRLISLGEARDITETAWKIRVILDEKAKTITVVDNGIGMTADELQKYICQIALSGALDFIQKYESNDAKGDSSENGIIGHFGLGFYSAFMVSDKVEILTRSYTMTPAVHWTCDENGAYQMEAAEASDTEDYFDSFGTAVIMHISSEGEEYLSSYKLKDMLEKYCAFMPTEIFFEEIKDEKEDKKDKDKEKEEPKPINDTFPLWQKSPSECTDEEYKEFYRKVFHDYKEPLFWIHLKADYPLNFKGILYFPRIGNEYESLEGQVKLFYNQVFVADNIKEVIPEYLLMLKGVLDCPELPLNVSRSYLQNSAYVTKISNHIVKKVSDKLNGMFGNDRENYSKLWRDLKTFVEYGSMRDHNFYGKVKNSILYENCDGSFETLQEYLDKAKEKHEGKVYYASDKTTQAKYISMYQSEGIEVVLLDKFIDTQFISMVENEDADLKAKFFRVDAEIGDALSQGEGEKNEAIEKLFKEVVPEKTEIVFSKIKDLKTPAVLTVSEENRRFEEMMKLYSISNGSEGMDMPKEQKLILNSDNPLIQKLDALSGENETKAKKLVSYIYTLAVMSQRQLTADEMNKFLGESYDILEQL